jgi:two-component system chemotaxis response regulator CheY
MGLRHGHYAFRPSSGFFCDSAAGSGLVGVSNYNLQKLNVLVVEGHQMMRRVMRDVLTSLGVNNVEVVTANELDKPENAQFQPDVIFTDWSPNCDGLNVIKKIRENKHNFDRYIPIVMVSAFTELKQVCMARDAGITEFLAKPVSATLIYRRIAAMVDNPRDFVETGSFFGPDRRRRQTPPKGVERRKQVFQYIGGGNRDPRAVPAKPDK